MNDIFEHYKIEMCTNKYSIGNLITTIPMYSSKSFEESTFFKQKTSELNSIESTCDYYIPSQLKSDETVLWNNAMQTYDVKLSKPMLSVFDTSYSLLLDQLVGEKSFSSFEFDIQGNWLTEKYLKNESQS